MQYLRILLFAMAVIVLAACNEETASIEEPNEEIIEEKADVIAPTNEEVKAITENFVTTIYTITQEMGASDEVPLPEESYDALAEKLGAVATEEFLLGGLKEVILNLCYGCDSNPLPKFYIMDDSSLTYENGILDESVYTVQVSYDNLMLDMRIQENMTLRFEDDTWKVQNYTLGSPDAAAYEELEQPIEEIEESEEEIAPQSTDTEEFQQYSVTPESYVGYWEPSGVDEYYFGMVTVYPDYRAEISIEADDAAYTTNWAGTLTFSEDNIATMKIEEDGRPGTVTLEVMEGSLWVEYDIEEVPADAQFTPWSGKGNFQLELNFRLTEAHFWTD